MTKKVVVSRDVVFDEEDSWGWNNQEEDYAFFPFFEENNIGNREEI